MNQKLQQNLNLQKNRIGLVSGSINLREYDEAEHDISASISPQSWDVEVSLRKGFDPIRDERQISYAKKKGITNGLETLVSDTVLHEFAHWELPFDSERGCPYNIYEHDKIKEAVKRILPQDKQTHLNYVTNAFEDLLINPRCREFKGSFSGQVLFWDNEGLSCEENGQPSFTPFYEAFVKLNMHLFGDNADTNLLKRHFSRRFHNKRKINRAVKKTIGELNLPRNIQDTSTLFDRTRWPQMAEIFTKNLADLLKTSPTERLSLGGDSIEQKSKTREGKEEVAYGRYSSNENQSTNFTSYEQLDALYMGLARAIPVDVEAMTREQSLSIASLTYRPFDDETDNPKKIKLSKLFITNDGLQFAYPNKPITIPGRSKIQRRSFPDFKMVVLDTSGSMKQAPDNSDNIGSTSFIPWGDNSKYHYTLLGFYGIEKFLQQQGIAQHIQHGLSMFSSHTRFMESNFSEIDEVRKSALSPEFGDTTLLNTGILEQSLQGRESFVISISDGNISNWDNEKEKFRELFQNNYYTHIQLGDESNFSQDLKSWGIPVFYVSSGDDLSKLMVDITKNTYRSFIRE